MNLPQKSTPLLAAAALVGGGLLLRQFKPKALDMPARQRALPPSDQGKRRQVRKGRDLLAAFLPDNAMTSFANSAITLGLSLAVLRVMDELVDDRERMF